MAIGGKFNMDAISAKVMNSRRVTSAMEQRIKQVFEKNKNEVIKEFENSSVTKEIRGGVSSSNISGILGGYGNLFSYIGFYSGEDPLAAITDYLKNLKFQGRILKTAYQKGRISVSYSLKWYDLEAVEALSPMPWESGNSWIRGIEQGISGYSYYMYGTFVGSRSGKGKQTKNKINMAPTFSPRRYLPTIIREIANRKS
jgi:hypothetical protein